MKIAVIFHSGDMDGLTSGALATRTFDLLKSNFPDLSLDYEIIGYNYGKNPEEDLWLDFNKGFYDYYQFIDITPPIEWLKTMKPLIESNKVKIEIFDHHKPVYNEIQKLEITSGIFHYYFDENYSGAYIYYVNLLMPKPWYYILVHDLFGATSIIDKFSIKKRYRDFLILLKSRIDTNYLFDIVKLVDSYDTWKWKNNEKQNYDALALNEYFLQHKDVKSYYEILFNQNFDISLMLTYGWTMIKINMRLASERKHFFFNWKYKNQNFIIINSKANVYDIDVVNEIKTEALNQELGQILNPELEQYSNIKAILFYNNIDFSSNKINFGVRQIDKEFDCNDFIKEFTNGNGGGHQAASGGQMCLTDFIKLTTKNQ